MIDFAATSKLRETPLTAVAERLGLQGRREGRSVRFKNDRFNIVITGQKFFDNFSGTGNYGAVSLVMHVLSVDFNLAVNWLADRNIICSDIPPIQNSPRPTYSFLYKQFGAPCPDTWPAARNYLIKRRHLPASFIDKLHSAGLIYSNSHNPNSSIVFLHRDLAGDTKGFTLRSTHDPAKGQKKFCPCMGEKEHAWFYLGDLASASTVVLVESPIDACSFSLLHLMPDTAVVSLAGWHCPDTLLDFILSSHKKIFVALDNDAPGNLGWFYIQLKILFRLSHLDSLPVIADSGFDDFIQFRFFLGKYFDTQGYSYNDMVKLLVIGHKNNFPVQILFPSSFDSSLFSRMVPVNKDWNEDLKGQGFVPSTAHC